MENLILNLATNLGQLVMHVTEGVLTNSDSKSGGFDGFGDINNSIDVNGTSVTSSTDSNITEAISTDSNITEAAFQIFNTLSSFC